MAAPPRATIPIASHPTALSGSHLPVRSKTRPITATASIANIQPQMLLGSTALVSNLAMVVRGRIEVRSSCMATSYLENTTLVLKRKTAGLNPRLFFPQYILTTAQIAPLHVCRIYEQWHRGDLQKYSLALVRGVQRHSARCRFCGQVLFG